jgi:hypothetical protein
LHSDFDVDVAETAIGTTGLVRGFLVGKEKDMPANVGHSLTVDRRQKANSKVKKGEGDRGDQGGQG